MTAPLLDARENALVTDGAGNLVLAVPPSDAAASVKVTTFSPASSGDGSGWYIAWRVKIGDAARTEDGVAHSATAGEQTSEDAKTGTVTWKESTVVVQIQLRAWHGDEVTPGGYPLSPADVKWGVEIGGKSESGDFGQADPPDTQGHWDEAAKYIQAVAVYDFANDKWRLSSSIEGGAA